MRKRVAEAIVAHLTTHRSSLHESAHQMHVALTKYAKTGGSTPERVAGARKAMLEDMARELLPGIERELGIRYCADDKEVRSVFVALMLELYLSYVSLYAAEDALLELGVPSEYRGRSIYRDVLSAAWAEHTRKLNAVAHLLAHTIAQSCECVEDADDSHAPSRHEEEESNYASDASDLTDSSSDAESLNDASELSFEEASDELHVNAATERANAHKLALEEEVAALATESEDMRDVLAELRSLEPAVARQQQQQQQQARQMHAREGKRRAIEALRHGAEGA